MNRAEMKSSQNNTLHHKKPAKYHTIKMMIATKKDVLP
jgi:hypothetical protein